MSPPPYFSKITLEGLARLTEAQVSGVPLVFAYLSVGDGGGAPITPASSMTALVNERARVSVNKTAISDTAPDTVRVEGLIPASIGGFTIREAGLWSSDGDLLAVASYPPVYKPSLAVDGLSVQEYIRILIFYSAVDAVALTVDENVVVAVQQDVEDALAVAIGISEGLT